MVPITRRLDPDDHYDGANTMEYIVEHDTGNKTDTDEGNANYFCTGTRNASAHYFVDDDSITQVVEDHDGAFHCGDGHGAYGITNRNSISIEMCRINGEVSQKTELNAMELTRHLMAVHGIPFSKVVRHYDASRKICPESFSDNNWARWNTFKSRLAGTGVVAPPTVIAVNSFTGVGIITASTLNVRNSADINSNIIGKLSKGTQVKIGGKSGTWYSIFFGAHGGWISSEYVKLDSIKPVEAPKPVSKNGIVSASSLNVRSGAGTTFSKIGSLPNGTKVKIASESNGWYSIYFGDHGGWVSKDYIKLV